MLSETNWVQGDWGVVRPPAVLDILTASGFRTAVHAAGMHAPANHVAILMGAVEFCDSTGFGVMVGGYKRAQAHSGRFALVGASAVIRHRLKITGLDRLFEVVDDLGDVLGPDGDHAPASAEAAG